MRPNLCLVAVPTILAFMVAAFVVALLLLRWLWAWTVPDLFPGAVEQGLVAGSISWYTALKLAIFLAVLAGFAGARKGQSSGSE
jgi:hypothetical protein